jgi:hypothetical protein
MCLAEPGCTADTVSGGFVPDHVNGRWIGLVSSESAGRISVTITTTSSAVSFPGPFATSQPNVGRVESFRRPDDDLVVASAVEPKLQPGSAPRCDDEVSEQRVGDGSDRADGDGNGRPGVDSGAEDGGEQNWNQAGRAQGRRSQYAGRLRSDRSNRAYASFGSGVVSSALAS